MDEFVVGWDGVMSFDPDEDAEDTLDRLMERLLESDLTDPTIVYDAATGKVSFETICKAVDPLAAVTQATDEFRAALHAAGIETQDEHDRSSVQFNQGPSMRPLVEA